MATELNRRSFLRHSVGRGCPAKAPGHGGPMATTKTLIVEARTFGGGWVGDVRSALSRRVNAMVAAQRRYSRGSAAWWERD